MTIAKFREDAGVMMPGIWCKGHEMEGRIIYDMNDVDQEQNEVGEIMVSKWDEADIHRPRCRSTQRHTRLSHRMSHSHSSEKRLDSISISCRLNLSMLSRRNVYNVISMSRRNGIR